MSKGREQPKPKPFSAFPPCRKEVLLSLCGKASTLAAPHLPPFQKMMPKRPPLSVAKEKVVCGKREGCLRLLGWK